MDTKQFEENLRRHAELVKKRATLCQTEEATKTALILPFLHDVLGFDTSDPSVLIPEYDIKTGAEKHERADYAILISGKPEVLIEAKWNGLSLDGYYPQLFKYFNATRARIGILTNGVEYRFYGDLNSDDVMDPSTYMEINMRSLSSKDIVNLAQYHVENFNVDQLIQRAIDIKTYQDVKRTIRQLMEEPDKTFSSFIRDRLNRSKRTKTNSTNLQGLIKQAFQECVYLEGQEQQPAPSPRNTFTPEEYEALYTVRTLLYPIISPGRLQPRNTKHYFSIHLDGNAVKWICRFYPVKSGFWTIHLPTENPKKPETHTIKSAEGLFEYKERLIQAVRKYDPSIRET